MSSKKGRKRNNLGAIERDILQELTFGDLLMSFLCSGRSTRAFYKNAHRRARERYRRKLALQRLMAQGFINQRGEYAVINDAGRRILESTINTVRHRLTSTKWDGKWRIITFDIPENMRTSRNAIRSILKRAGFIKLQNSTWIFPHECEELSRLLTEDPRLTKHVLYGVLEKIQNDGPLRKIFKLK